MGLPKPKSAPIRKVESVHKSIKLRPQHPSAAGKIQENHKLNPVIARVLAARGLSVGEELSNYIEPTLKTGLPHPDKLLNLDKACALIGETLRAGKGIAVCCDFDVDGLSGGAEIAHFLTSIGAKTKVYVPDRFVDGYGLNESMIRGSADENFGLVITVDFGTTNQKELSLARELGLKTIVIDHHHVGDAISTADVFINPNQPGCGFADKILCASGLAWYLLLGLKAALPEAKDVDAKAYLDLACLGTICDMVPLIGVNRVIAKRGLELLGKTTRPGLMALKNVIGLHKQNVSCSHVSFGIGPRINAAGRMIHGNLVIELLTTSDSNQSDKLARRLNQLNLERQNIEERVKERAIQQVERGGFLPSGILVWDKEFHTGVIGIVAQRLVETFYRPSAVLGLDQEGIYKGSVRGIKDFSVIEALAECGDLLIKFGGHQGAGGFSVKEENLEALAERFESVCAARLADIETDPIAVADTSAKLADIEFSLIQSLGQLAPFGIGNPGPLLLFEDLRVVDVRSIKNTHLKATLADGSRFITAVMWKKASHPALEKGALVRVVGKPELSKYQGVEELQIVLQAVEGK